MRKITTPQKVCNDCGSVLIPEQYEDFCDFCQEKITKNPLDLTVFWESYDSDTQHYEFCSWRCTIGWLKNNTLNKKKMSFISLPDLGGCDVEFIEEYQSFFDAFASIMTKESDA